MGSNRSSRQADTLEEAVPASHTILSDADWLRIGDVFGLTPRELEVVQHLFDGDSEGQTATLLGVKYSTVHTHVKNIYAKLDVHDQRELLVRILPSIWRVPPLIRGETTSLDHVRFGFCRHSRPRAQDKEQQMDELTQPELKRAELQRPLFEEMRLSSQEIAMLDKYFEMARDARRNPADFVANAGPVAFTPGAALAIGVANLAFAVYTEYGKSIADRLHIQENMKRLAERLVEIEAVSKGAASVDVATRLRNELRERIVR